MILRKEKQAVMAKRGPVPFEERELLSHGLVVQHNVGCLQLFVILRITERTWYIGKIRTLRTATIIIIPFPFDETRLRDNGNWRPSFNLMWRLFHSLKWCGVELYNSNTALLYSSNTALLYFAVLYILSCRHNDASSVFSRSAADCGCVESSYEPVWSSFSSSWGVRYSSDARRGPRQSCCHRYGREYRCILGSASLHWTAMVALRIFNSITVVCFNTEADLPYRKHRCQKYKSMKLLTRRNVPHTCGRLTSSVKNVLLSRIWGVYVTAVQ